MALSRVYLGESGEHEQRLARAAGVDLAKLHALAQRVSWGILMGSARTGVDLDAQAERLLAEFSDVAPAQLTVALLRTFQGRHEDARSHLARARALSSPEQPFAALLPSGDQLAPPSPPELEEVEPGRVYRVRSGNVTAANPFGNLGVATFVRLRSGALVCINPVAMEAIADQLRALGDVTHVVAPAKYHSEHVPQAQRLFPRARAFGVPGHRGYPNAAHVRFDGYLDDAAPLFPDEIEQVTMHGVDVGDVWLIDRASGTLLVTDAVFVDDPRVADDAYRTPFGLFYAWAWGALGRVAFPSYQPVMWQDVPAYQASLRRALERDFRHLGSSHGPWHALDGDARAELRASLDWFLRLGRLGALGYVGDFVKRHPGIFVRLVREQLAKG